jgi:hypothetical protein
MPFTVTFTSSVLVAGSVRSSGSTLSVDDQTARMLVDLGVATASGLTAQTGAVAPQLASQDFVTANNKVKAWVNFNGTGTIEIRSGFNVSSITDGGAGIYTVNFTTAMSDANYAAVVSTKDAGGTWSVLRAVAQTTSAVAVGVRGTNSYGDTDTIAVAVLR